MSIVAIVILKGWIIKLINYLEAFLECWKIQIVKKRRYYECNNELIK